VAIPAVYAQQSQSQSPEETAAASIAARAQANQVNALPLPGSDGSTVPQGGPPTQQALDNASASMPSSMDMTKIGQPIKLEVQVTGRIDRFAKAEDGSTMRSMDSQAVAIIHATVPFMNLNNISVPYSAKPSIPTELVYSEGNSLLLQTGYKVDLNSSIRIEDSRDSGRADRISPRQAKLSLNSELVQSTSDEKPDLYGSLNGSVVGDGSYYLSFQPYTITIFMTPKRAN
jgi:hypothetical protein